MSFQCPYGNLFIIPRHLSGVGLLTDTKLSGNLATIPEAVRNYLELESGDRIEWFIEDGEVIVRKKTVGTEHHAAEEPTD